MSWPKTTFNDGYGSCPVCEGIVCLTATSPRYWVCQGCGTEWNYNGKPRWAIVTPFSVSVEGGRE